MREAILALLILAAHPFVDAESSNAGENGPHPEVGTID